MLNLDRLLQENDTHVKMDKNIKDSGTESEFVGLITVWLVSLDIRSTHEHRSIHVINDRKSE
jgi:hypothetical protein